MKKPSEVEVLADALVGAARWTMSSESFALAWIASVALVGAWLLYRFVARQ